MSTEAAAQSGCAWVRAYSGRTRCDTFTHLVAPAGQTRRAKDDALAAWVRWSDHSGLDDYAHAQTVWHAVLERVRVETLASRDLPGMCSNLSHCHELEPHDPSLAAVYCWARSLGSLEITRQADVESVEEPVRRAAPPRAVLDIPHRFAGINGSRTDTVTTRDLAAFAEQMVAALQVAEDARNYRRAVQPLVTWLSQRTPQIDKPAESSVLADNDGDQNALLVRQILNEKSLEIDAAAGDDDEYRMFSKSLDEEQSAQAWFHPSDADLLKDILGDHRQEARRLAHRLMRQLQAAANRSWDFELEEGLLDNHSLASLAIPTPIPRVFRAERAPTLLDTQICLLVDQSGSMRGKRQALAAQAIDLAVHVLELCGLPCEVLGYTTRFAADNPLVEAWSRLGSPSGPGRLNATRHILFKQFRQPWKRCRPWLGLMLREDFGRENLDGEALAWAARRLLARGARRNVIIVISDGAPFDAATAVAHHTTYLENHLRAVITGLERRGVSLIAIGAGVGVGRFYRHSETVRDPQQIPEYLFARIAEVLLR